jgi:hypothetical protein
MADTRFDPSQAIRFDLGRGAVQLDGGPSLVVSVDALLALCRGAGADAARDFGRRLGTEIGRRVGGRIGFERASVESVIEHLGGDLALLGLGSLGAERWGKALVLTLSDSPLGAEGDAIIAAVLEGALQRGTSRDASVVPLARDDRQLRLLVVSAGTADRVRGWLEGGSSWGDVLAKLHGARGAS